MPLLYLIIYNRVPTIHKQPTEPHFANDTDSTVLDIDPYLFLPNNSS